MNTDELVAELQEIVDNTDLGILDLIQSVVEADGSSELWQSYLKLGHKVNFKIVVEKIGQKNLRKINCYNMK